MGLYVPQVFLNKWFENILNINEVTAVGDTTPEILKDELSSPDNEYYWDAWDEIVRTAILSIDGRIYNLEQEEGDLWAVDSTNKI